MQGFTWCNVCGDRWYYGVVEDDDLRWTYWDNQYGGPGEDELQGPPRTITYTAGTIDPVALKAALAARALANPKPEHWARKLGRRIANARTSAQ
jgi:hypothetical protein